MDKIKTPAFDGQSETQGLDKSNEDSIQHPDNKSELDIEPEFSIDEEELPLIPEGEYTLGYDYYETGFYFGGPKIKLAFTVLDEGEHHGTKLHKYYNVRGLIGKAKKYGRFKPPGWNGELIRDWIKLFGKPAKMSRLSLRVFRNVLIKAMVSTVKKDSKKHPLPSESYYSKIAELISIEDIDYK